MLKTPITNLYEKGRQLFKEDKKDEARDCIDLAIVNVASKINKENYKDDDLIEGITVRLWYERLWYFLEKNNLLLGQDVDYNDEEDIVYFLSLNDSKKEKTQTNI